MSTKLLLRKAKQLAAAAAVSSKTNGSAKSKSKPLQDEEDYSDDEDFNDDDSEDDEDDEQQDDEDDEEEEDDVTEEALQRMMKLLGDDLDPSELAQLEEEESEDGEEEALYEDLDERDGDVVPVEKTTVNDKEALKRVLATFKSDTSFFDTLTLTYPKDLEIPDAENDLERELEFYKQSLWAVNHAEHLYKAADVPFTRPSDYFAEMLKTDDHMSRIRQSLLDEQAGFKASDDARKLRDAKKFGKKVQVERLKEREKEKKDVSKRLDGLKKKRKDGDGGFTTTEDFDIALEDAIAGPSKRARTHESERGSSRGGRGGRGGAAGGRGGISRRGRDAKFGNPTASRRPKENNDRVDGDNGGGRRGRGGSRGGRGGSRGGGGGGAPRGASKRLGKSRRN